MSEQLELIAVEEEPKPKRAAREDQVVAGLYVERLFPTPPEGIEDRHKRQRDTAFIVAMKHLSQLCGNGAKRNGHVQYDYTEVYLAWEALYEKYQDEKETGAWRNPPTLLGVAYGASPWIETWRKEIMDNLPPVYDSWSHDAYVRKYAHVLRAFCFHYGATGQPNRLTAEQVEELGLL